MARGPSSPEEERPAGGWKGLVRDGGIALAIVAIVLGAFTAYAWNWPPLVVVESRSMQHGDTVSFLGVIDTGDMVFQQAAPARQDVVTYIEGRARGYMTYGDYGDVIIFRQAGSPVPVIHRAIMYATLHADGTADVQPELLLLPEADWSANNASGPTRNPVGLTTLTVYRTGFAQDTSMTFAFDDISNPPERSGYITKGDNNDNLDPIREMPRLEDVQGRARGEIPWIGLLKLSSHQWVGPVLGMAFGALVAVMVVRTEQKDRLLIAGGAGALLGLVGGSRIEFAKPLSGCCPDGWGTYAPRNSWDSLLLVLILLIALPFVIEYAGHGWVKYVSPRLPKIGWRRNRVRRSPGPKELDEDGIVPDDAPPREGSSEP